MMSARIDIPQETMEQFCHRWKITELALFGSVLRDDFTPQSDVDVLVRFAPDAGHGLFDLVRMQDELSEILGRPVDLVTRNAVEHSRNELRRKLILDSAEVIYAA
ncbi:nucleotidyltransferase [Chlorobaculum sp. 24CR]|nr:nucleotidyltransferase [Chlorobaculum sp. 24CR]